MKIAIDLDGVVFNSEMLFMAAAEIYDATVLKRNSVVRPYETRVQEKYDWTDEEFQGFIERYARSRDFDVMPCAADVIGALGEKNELFVISARGQFFDEELVVASEKLDGAGIRFNHYHFGHFDKRQVALDCGIDVMIDDRYDVCEALSEMGIFCLYFKMAGRKEVPETNMIRTVHNWGDVYRILMEKGAL